MKKYLLTGYSGFVSRHFLEYLDQNRVESIIFNFQPDYIVPLASYSSVAFSWKEPILSFQNNMNIYLNLLESVRKLNQPVRILSIGSSEEYGNVDEKSLPLTEEHIPRPVSPYAVARVSQEMISKVYVDGYGLDIIMTRSFNHIGPFQRDIFVISSFAKQLLTHFRNSYIGRKSMSCENTVFPVYMSHPSDDFGVAIGQKKFQVDKKKKRALISGIT